MNTAVFASSLQLRSLIKANGELELSLQRVATPEPAADEVVLRVEATPINPSDIGLLFGAADLATLTARGSGEHALSTGVNGTRPVAVNHKDLIHSLDQWCWPPHRGLSAGPSATKKCV